jgi:alpha-mannosidase
MSMEDVNAVIRRWRTNVKLKMRGIASFEERAQLRFDALKNHLYRQRVTVNNWQMRRARYLSPGQYQFRDKNWQPFRVGQPWGGEDMTAFFRQRVVIPKSLAGEKVALQIFLGGDSLVTINGVPWHGLDIFRNEFPLTGKAKAGEVFDLQIESYMNFQGVSAKTNELLVSDLVAIDRELRDAYWDLWCIAKLLAVPNLDAKLAEFIEFHLWKAMKLIPLQGATDAEFRAAALDAQRHVRAEVYGSSRFKGDGLMHLVGHSHLDVVYMWPYREFVRKIGRTHATMLRLMEEYPQFKFVQSQAKIYADMKQYFPALFRQVKRRVAEGRWEPIGAFWLEPDCNLISGESFVRQILHGQRFLKENFGFTSQTCWQPDVFGLSWAMPQILHRAGIRYFLTNKMVAWNDTNPWTLNTFWWEGFDGSRVLGIVPPGHFIGTVDPDHIDRQWRNFADKTEIGETLHIYGWGDGGGGVDPEMIESAKRYQDLPGLVRLKFSTAEEAFASIARKVSAAKHLPVLRDEIYLEEHRGTFTHRGRLKKLNRRAELLYREAELLATFAWLKTGKYPEQLLDAGWKDLLNAQFHDSLPGTHVNKVYPELLADYDRIFAAGNQVRTSALSVVVGAASRPRPDSLVIFNSMLFERTDYASVPEALVKGRAIAGTVQQTVADLDGTKRRLFRLPATPAMGFRILKLGAANRPASTVSVTGNSLENEFLRAKFNDGGELVSLWDKEHNREVLAPGQVANQFQLFEDTPGKYDAWDIIESYMDHPINIAGNAKLRVDERGPVRASLRLEKKIGQSKLVQRISLCAGSRRLEFETQVDWVERQRLLKVAFPVNINAAFATYDIAYGNMPRPTHRNTSYDRAKFEVPAHQWMDLSQTDYGVSVLNDCKYGCDVLGQTMRLTLLKGSISPDPKADMETHHFTYALYPHVGDWRTGNVIPEAMTLNHPVLAQPASAKSVKVTDGESLFTCTAPNLTLEAVKRSEDGKDLVIRLVERHNAATQAELVFPRPIKSAWSCDLMEKKEQKLAVEGCRVKFTAKPYEIVTLRVVA